MAQWSRLLTSPAAQSAPTAAALAAAALSIDSSQAHSWLQLGDSLSVAVRRQLAARIARPNDLSWSHPQNPTSREGPQLSANDELCLRHVALCYGRVLQLGESRGAEQMRLLLRLLQLMVQHDTPQVRSVQTPYTYICRNFL